MKAAQTTFDLLERVKEVYAGARQSFVLARLTLKSGVDVARLTPESRLTPAAEERLRRAIREVCVDIDT